MHLMVPFASSVSAAAGQALSTLELPMLDRVLRRMDATHTDTGDEYTLSPPHERALAAAWGWQAPDGNWPFAAQAAAQDGLAVDGQTAWGLVSPVHWHVGTDQVQLTDPAALALDEATSRALFATVQTMFADDGWQLHWGAPTRWYATHPSLATLPCAALDRVIGRNVDLWLTANPHARALRRLQSEVQMLLYNHPANDAREARGALTVNSFWLSGCGLPQPVRAVPDLVWDDRLRQPALDGDWAGWCATWQALDAGPLGDLLVRVEGGQPAVLTLCGERSAQRFEARPRPWWRRGPWVRQRPARAMLQTL
jgi:hypothetical protein